MALGEMTSGLVYSSEREGDTRLNIVFTCVNLLFIFKIKFIEYSVLFCSMICIK